MGGPVSKLHVCAALCAAAFVALASTSVRADSADGKFAIEGAGYATCAAFTAARNERSDKAQNKPTDAYARFIGWIEGYLTAANRYNPDTFDLTPWQTAEIYGVIVGAYCEKHADTRLFAIVQQLVENLKPDRLKVPSEILTVVAKGPKGVTYNIPVEVVRRAQEALKKQRLYQGEVNGQYDAATQKSFENFQAAVGVTVTGMPDPMTLWLLFSPPKSKNG